MPAIEHAGGRHFTLPLLSRNPMTIWANAARLEELIRTETATIVHARSRAPAWSANLACQRTGAHFVTTYHGTYNEDLPFKRRYNSVMARGERVIVASRFIADLIARQHRTDPDVYGSFRAAWIPHLFDPGAVAGHRVARLALERRLPEVPVVLPPGRLTSGRGRQLIEALAQLFRLQRLLALVGSDQGDCYSGRPDPAGRSTRRWRLAASVGEGDDMPARCAGRRGRPRLDASRKRRPRCDRGAGDGDRPSPRTWAP